MFNKEKEENKKLTAQNTELQTTNDTLSKENESLRAENEKLSAENETLQADVKKAGEEKTAVQADLKKANDTIEKKDYVIAELKKTPAEQSAEVVSKTEAKEAKGEEKMGVVTDDMDVSEGIAAVSEEYLSK